MVLSQIGYEIGFPELPFLMKPQCSLLQDRCDLKDMKLWYSKVVTSQGAMAGSGTSEVIVYSQWYFVFSKHGQV